MSLQKSILSSMVRRGAIFPEEARLISDMIDVIEAGAFATVTVSSIKSGATQVAAGAAAGELWKTASHATLPDNVILIGV